MKRISLKLLIVMFLGGLFLTASKVMADAPQSGAVYYITSAESGKLLDVYGDKTVNKANVQIYEKTSGSNTTQQFALTKTKGGWFSITPVSNKSVAVNPFSDTPKAGTNVNVYTVNTNDKTQGWYVEAVGSAYKISSAYNKNLVLTAEGTANKSNVKIAAYSAGSKKQLWTFTNINGNTQSTEKEKETTAPAPAENQPVYADVSTGTWYNFVNAASGKVLDVCGSSSYSVNKSNVQIYARGTETNLSQQFAMVKNTKSGYNIYTRSNAKLAVNPYSNKPANKTNVNVYTMNKNDKTQGWLFEKSGNYYIVRSAYNTSLVLAAAGNGNAANVCLQTYKKDSKYQLWTLAAPKTVSKSKKVKTVKKAASKKAPWVYPRRAGDKTGVGVKKVSKALKGMPIYNQTKHSGYLGKSRASIADYGCLACSYAMVESYYRGKAVNLEKFIQNELKFDADGNMLYKGNKVAAKYTKKGRPTFTDIYNLINKGKPVIAAFETNQYDSPDARSHYHWAVIYAYKNVELDANGKPVNLTAANFMVKDSGGIAEGKHAGKIHSLNDFYAKDKLYGCYSHVPYIRYR